MKMIISSGDKNCGPFRIKVMETDDSIIWTVFAGRNSGIFKGITELEFEKDQ
jgi:hypothetical protein